MLMYYLLMIEVEARQAEQLGLALPSQIRRCTAYIEILWVDFASSSFDHQAGHWSQTLPTLPSTSGWRVTRTVATNAAQDAGREKGEPRVGTVSNLINPS